MIGSLERQAQDNHEARPMYVGLTYSASLNALNSPMRRVLLLPHSLDRWETEFRTGKTTLLRVTHWPSQDVN